MWHRAFVVGGGAALPWRSLARRSLSSGSSGAVDSIILRSLKEHYLEVSKMTPPPAALDKDGPVLRRSYKDEEITISVMRLANIMPAGAEGDDGDDSINQLFLHVDVSKPEREDSLHFLCGLYPDAVGIHSVCLRPKVAASSGSVSLSKYQGRVFQELEQKMRDAFHIYIEARGVNESLFPFLQAWLYVKDHRNLMHWFKRVGTFINEHKPA
ncbi:uncharacterized protein At2g39795, mitochondrial isoform X2 [Elaeis guineensis]|uniref:Uncharacterized protein LOC105034473 isoform X2 n=1 Tax=Elaeis guineensis var. tenera TaxID=51953 RepID=A0A8N4I6B4_ELAGV|nr:uncharacterized protein LOC105034473 isoform X2 [Elaeis guineensis]